MKKSFFSNWKCLAESKKCSVMSHQLPCGSFSREARNLPKSRTLFSSFTNLETWTWNNLHHAKRSADLSVGRISWQCNSTRNCLHHTNCWCQKSLFDFASFVPRKEGQQNRQSGVVSQINHPCLISRRGTCKVQEYATPAPPPLHGSIVLRCNVTSTAI